MLRASTRQAGRWPALVALALGAIAPILATAGEADENRPDLRIAPASDEPARAIAGFRVPEGFAIRPWAAEPLLANPVAFCVDDRGRVYVAETFRLDDGVTDNRSHMDWLDDDLAATTVEDRVAIYRKYFDDETFAQLRPLPRPHPPGRGPRRRRHGRRRDRLRRRLRRRGRRHRRRA